MTGVLGLSGMYNAGKRALLGFPPSEEKVTDEQAKATIVHHTTESVKSATKSLINVPILGAAFLSMQKACDMTLLIKSSVNLAVAGSVFTLALNQLRKSPVIEDDKSGDLTKPVKVVKGTSSFVEMVSKNVAGPAMQIIGEYVGNYSLFDGRSLGLDSTESCKAFVDLAMEEGKLTQLAQLVESTGFVKAVGGLPGIAVWSGRLALVAYTGALYGEAKSVEAKSPNASFNMKVSAGINAVHLGFDLAGMSLAQEIAKLMAYSVGGVPVASALATAGLLAVGYQAMQAPKADTKKE